MLSKLRSLRIPSVLALLAGVALSQSAMAQVGTGGVNQLANPGWEIPNKADWTAVGNTPEITVGTATYYNAGTCPPDSPAENVVSHSGAGVANIYGNFIAKFSLSSWSQTLAVPANSTWSAGGWTYCSHEDLISGKNSFYYVVNFLDATNGVISSYQSYIVTNMACGVVNPQFPEDTWVFLAVTNQMQASGGVATSTNIGSIASGILPAPANAVSVQFEALFVQQSDNAGGSVYLDDANLGLVTGALPPTITTPVPNLVTLSTNTNMICTATSVDSSITNFQVIVQSSALGGKVVTTTNNLNSPLLTITGLGTTTATISLALSTNVIYHSVVVKATDANHITVTATASFDTLRPTLVIECSDFNFTSNGVAGSFIDTPPNGGLWLYTNQVGTEGVDEHKKVPSGANSNKDQNYRLADAVIVGDAAPASGPSGVEQKFVTEAATGDTTTQELEVGYNSVGDWLDFTRTFGPSGSAPAGTYNIWCYMATDGSGVQTGIYQVTSDPTQPNQTTNFLGNIGTTAFSDAGWNSYEYVPMEDQFGNLISVTLGAGQQTLRSVVVNNPNLGFYMLMPATVILTPSLLNVVPDGLHPFEPAAKFSATVGPANGAALVSSSIQLLLNGADVTSSATLTSGTGGSWSITYPLMPNEPYVSILNVSNSAGLSSSFTNTFDTFNAANLQVEAVDYDFSTNNGAGWIGGLFIDNPVPTCDANANQVGELATNSYFEFPMGFTPGVDPEGLGAIAQPGIDINFLNAGQGAAGTEIYRADGVGSQSATDYLRPKFVAAQAEFGDPNIGPVNIGYYAAGYWMNYTRDYPPGNFYVWGRLAGGNGAFSGTTLSEVTSGLGTTNQTTSLLGSFSDPNAIGWQSWHWIPLLNSNGSPAIITLGGQSTLRLTSGNNVNAEFFMLTPAPAEPALTITAASGQLKISIPTQTGFNYTVYFTTNLTVPNWQPVGATIVGDGTTNTVTEPITGQQGYYKVE